MFFYDKFEAVLLTKRSFPMVKRKSRFSKFIGALTGTPYDKLLKQIENLPDVLEDDRQLAREIRKFMKIIVKANKEGKIDDDEHDLLIEELEDIDPEGRTFDKINDEDDEYYSTEGVPDAPSVKTGKNIDLDSLMRKKSNQFTGSFGREEFESYREQMALEFAEESRNALEEGYSNKSDNNIDPTGRVFRDDEEDALETKRRIAIESGLINETENLEEEYTVDEDGVEWYEDENGQWWYREPDENDWYPAEE
ncbi:MAG: hypothetical protein CMB56_003420 [Methanobacteriota archaeon]|nr:MAG: hypothetical protein CMB56_003420 [Euryarchaeota archaeon]|tara:strand:- start:655 stop:1410 length:756 start_codon:yes stop_codon:yes gene_type:complete